MSVQQRIFIPMILTTFLVSAAIVTANAMIYSRIVETEMRQEINTKMRIANAEVQLLLHKAFVNASGLACDGEIIKAYETGNNAALVEYTEALFSQSDIELCYLLDASGQLIALLHQKEDPNTGFAHSPGFVAAVKGQPYISIESNDEIRLSAVSAMPVKDSQGETVGVVKVGYRLDTEIFAYRIKGVVDYDVSVYQELQRVATTETNEYDERITDVTAPGGVSMPTLRRNEYFNHMDTIGGVYRMTLYAPLVDTNNVAVGMLYLGKPMSARSEAVRAFVMTGSVITVTIFLLSAFGTWKLVKYIARPIEDKLDKILYDPLTGLHNRRYLSEKLGNLVKFLSRSNSCLSVIMLDIDCFKLYNDNYGHAEGDKCLKSVADVLTRCVDRAEDFIVRYGGEEFTLVLPNTNEAGAKKIAIKILERIRAKQIPHEKSIVTSYVTVSLGVVTGRVLPSHNADDYIKLADELLYLSKQNGRNRFTFKSF
jgi:diguanylate cyclase (GGDEF)-like protein